MIYWISYDQINNKIDTYPHPYCNMIETAFQSKYDSIPILEFFNATIYFDYNQENHIQRTSESNIGGIHKVPGTRTIKRLEIDENITTINIPISYKGLHNSDNIIFNQELSLDKINCVSDDEIDLVYQWQWSYEVFDKCYNSEKWGIYSVEDNEKIEKAYQDKNTSVTIEIGVRKFIIIFEDNSIYGLQTAQDMHQWSKKRIIRRVMKNKSEIEKEYNELLSKNTEGQCAICLEEFNDTKLLDTLKLNCNHVLHCICAQILADDSADCPLCRASVDWTSLNGVTTGNHSRYY